MEEGAETLPTMVIFQNGAVIVSYSNRSSSFDQKVIVEARMLHVVNDGGKKSCGYMHSAPPLPVHRIGHAEECVQRKENVTSMLEAVVSIVVVALRADSPNESLKLLVVEPKFAGQTCALKNLVQDHHQLVLGIRQNIKIDIFRFSESIGQTFGIHSGPMIRSKIVWPWNERPQVAGGGWHRLECKNSEST